MIGIEGINCRHKLNRVEFADLIQRAFQRDTVQKEQIHFTLARALLYAVLPSNEQSKCTNQNYAPTKTLQQQHHINTTATQEQHRSNTEAHQHHNNTTSTPHHHHINTTSPHQHHNNTTSTPHSPHQHHTQQHNNTSITTTTTTQVDTFWC